ncbi:MAG: hypothetical protein SFZ02_18985 [bacterium]|nr:hypothetical protein [bacterium]
MMGRWWLLVMVVIGAFLSFFDLTPLPLLQIGEGEKTILRVGVGTRYIVSAEDLGVGHTLITINSTTRTITAYDPTTDTHTPLFTCPDGCYDPVYDRHTPRIGFVTDSGFGIYDIISNDYAQFSADFGVYGYKGGAAFRDDLAYVAYEARFDMDTRLMLTDLISGTTTDLYVGGVGNPSWTADGEAVLSTDGATLWRVPINGADVTSIMLPHPAMYTDLYTLFGDGWLYRGIDEIGYTLFFTDDSGTIELASAPAIVSYSASELAGKIALSTFDPRGGNYTLLVINLTPKSPLHSGEGTFTKWLNSLLPLLQIGEGGRGDEVILSPPQPLPIAWRGAKTYLRNGFHPSFSTWWDVGTRYIVSTRGIGDEVILSQRRDIFDISLSPDGRYVAWVEENADMGFGFYDVWIADLSADEITPLRVAENITTPAERPSGVAWMD